MQVRDYPQRRAIFENGGQMTSVLIVPGLSGSGQEHWQSHWERGLADAHRVQQRDWDHPNLIEWSHRLADAIEERPGAILVGHSLLPGAKLACCGVVINRAMQRKSRRDDRRDRQA